MGVDCHPRSHQLTPKPQSLQSKPQSPTPSHQPWILQQQISEGFISNLQTFIPNPRTVEFHPQPKTQIRIREAMLQMPPGSLMGDRLRVPREQKMLKGRLPRVTYHQVYSNTKRSKRVSLMIVGQYTNITEHLERVADTCSGCRRGWR